MALPPVRLDTLTWEDLRALAQRRIPAASAGRWTHHAPVDPGVTLLELFAFLLEQRVFLLDQIPDCLARALLRLLGERPRPSQAARTVLALEASTIWDAAAAAPVLAAGSVFRAQHPELRDVALSTRDALAPLPLAAPPDVAVEGEDRAADLAAQRRIALMPRLGEAGDVRIVLWLRRAPPAAAAGAPIGLLLVLDTPGIAPQWTADATEMPPPAHLTWWYSGPGGTPRPYPADAVSDGTGGLRRSGIVRLPLPEEWTPIDAPRPAEGAPYALWLRTDRASFAEPPRLARIDANAVVALNREHKRIEVDVAAALGPEGADAGPDETPRMQRELATQLAKWLPHSDLELDLPDALRPPLETTVRLQLEDRRGEWRDWHVVDDFAFAGPADPVFVVDRERGRFLFGDGLTGRVPAPAPRLRLALEVGGGPRGNLGSGRGWDLDAPANGRAITARNPVPASGGLEPEGVEAATERVQGAFERVFRAITGDDFRTIVENLAGLARHRVHVAPGYHPHFPCIVVPDAVTLFVVPRIRRERGLAEEEEPAIAAPLPDPGALAGIRSALERARLVGTQVFVRAPVYRAVALELELEGDPGEVAGLRPPLWRALCRHLDAVIGGDDGEGWPFGRPLRPSELLRVADGFLDGRGRIRAIGIGLDGDGAFESCADTPIGPHDLVYLDRLRLALEPAGAPLGAVL